MTESTLQSQIIEKINDLGIYDLISNKHQFIDIANTRNQDNYQPFFSINYLLRDKYLRYSKIVLESLKTTEIVSGEKIKNISLDCAEKLYPDILLFNYKDSKYFILELKRSAKAEREAITELLGYRLEVKNHLPFINNGEVPLIIVSTEFNDLLLHSIASLLLDNIPILCLKPIVNNDAFECFEIINVSSWTNIGTDTLDSQAFSGCTIALYGKDSNTVNEDAVFADICISLDFLKNDANRIGSHGFCITWKNFGAENISSQIRTDYFISIFTINPYNIFYNSIGCSNKQDILSKHIAKTIEETDAKFSADYSYELLTQNMIKFLKDKYSPMFEMFIDYKMFKSNLLEHGSPVLCDAWGEIGDYIRGLYIYPSMKILIDRNTYAYQNPNTFFRLFNYLTREYTFANGMDVCGEYLNFGVELGNLLNLLNAYKSNKSNLYIENRISFCTTGLINSFHEVGLLSTDVPEIILSIDNIQDTINCIENYCTWFLNQIECIEHECFSIGFSYCFFFENNDIQKDFKTKYFEQYTSFTNNVYSLIVSMLFDYLDTHHGIQKPKDVVSIFAEIFMSFDIHKWDSPSQLNTLIDRINKDDFMTLLQNAEDEFKFSFSIDNAYTIFNLFKAVSFCSERNNDVSKLVNAALKNTDINWLLEQINQFTVTHPNATPLIHIYEDKRVTVEISKEASDFLLKKDLKENEVIIKISTNIIDISIKYNIRELFIAYT